MSSIHDITQNGTAITLGPLTVGKVYPFKPSAKPNLFFLASDQTGKSAIKIWGAAASCGIKEGDVVTLVGQGARGILKREEYNGNWCINANDVRVDIQGGASVSSVDVVQPHQQSYPGQASAAAQTTNTGVDTLPLVMDRCADATALYVDSLVQRKGFSRDEALMLAANAPSWHALFWFGEKGLTK